MQVCREHKALQVGNSENTHYSIYGVLLKPDGAVRLVMQTAHIIPVYDMCPNNYALGIISLFSSLGYSA